MYVDKRLYESVSPTSSPIAAHVVGSGLCTPEEHYPTMTFTMPVASDTHDT